MSSTATPTATGLRVVVVGATGNIGTSAVTALGQAPEVESIVGVARRLPTWPAPKTTWERADIAEDDPGRLYALFRGADVVIHLAWLFQPTHNPMTTWRTNVLGSIRVFEAAARAAVPALVHASSVGAYSPGPKDRAVDERWPTHGWPLAAYTREKAYLERFLDAFEREQSGAGGQGAGVGGGISMRIVRLRPGFVLKRAAASQQRRLFFGPLLPARMIARPGAVPAVPDLPGLRFQVVHSEDIGEACRLAALRPVRGAFNLATEPVVDARLLADVLGARRVRMPAAVARAALAAAWRLHLVPASPQLFDAVLHLPVMDTTRARTELGWSPRHDATEAISSLLAGLREGAGMDTHPLAPTTTTGRIHELMTGVGQRP